MYLDLKRRKHRFSLKAIKTLIGLIDNWFKKIPYLLINLDGSKLKKNLVREVVW